METINLSTQDSANQFTTLHAGICSNEGLNTHNKSVNEIVYPEMKINVIILL